MRSEYLKTRPELVREVFRIFKASRDIAIAGGNKGAAKLRYGVEAIVRPWTRSSISHSGRN